MSSGVGKEEDGCEGEYMKFKHKLRLMLEISINKTNLSTDGEDYTNPEDDQNFLQQKHRRQIINIEPGKCCM